jgi:hypothetical protein
VNPDRYKYTYEGVSDFTGLPIWSCRREGAGVVGYGPTQKDALTAFLDLEDDVCPTPAERAIEQAIDDQLHDEAFGNGN